MRGCRRRQGILGDPTDRPDRLLGRPPGLRDGTSERHIHHVGKLAAKETVKRLRRPYDLKLQVFLNRLRWHHLVQLFDVYTHAEDQTNVYPRQHVSRALPPAPHELRQAHQNIGGDPQVVTKQELFIDHVVRGRFLEPTQVEKG